MKIRSVAMAVLMAGAAVTPSAFADETTFCNFKITTLPYTITTQGHYCFDRNLSTAITTGNAITINSSYVMLDLNGFKLGGGSAGPATLANGIYALDRTNITVRGGNLRGFLNGIVIDSGTVSAAQNTTIENNVVDGNYGSGIFVAGGGILVRNNLVTNTGGGAAPTTCGQVFGIALLGNGCNFDAESGVVVDNTVINTVGAIGSGIFAFGLADVVRENVVLRTNMGVGPAIGGKTCRDNTVAQTTGTPYQCTFFVGTNSTN